MSGTKRVVVVVVAVLLVVALASYGLVSLFGATNDEPAPNASKEPSLAEPERTAPNDPLNDQRFAAFYKQEPSWTECLGGAECADVKVPMDWSNPERGEVALKVVRHKASGDAIGSLIVNPGGPGASGVDYVGKYVSQVADPSVRKAYNVVGFDPRGVGGSQPIDCVPDSELDAFLFEDLDPETTEGLVKLKDGAQKFAKGCQQRTGELLEFVDTVSAARDMDVIREVVGDKRLNYLGKSYGTLLGATYAGLYPGSVGRMVLDGALDPTSSNTDVTVGQSRGIERALRRYLAYCLETRGCPFEGSVDDAAARIAQLLREVDDKPLPTGDPARPLTPGRALIGVVTPLYANQSWPTLTSALKQAFNGKGDGLAVLADMYADRQSDGSYASNIMEAFSAVNCLDYAVDDSKESMEKTLQLAKEAAPTFGEYMGYGEATCGAWPYKPTRDQSPIRAEGAPAILVVGTTGDMATPYEWAEGLADQLDSGRLLTFEGDGHTAYMRGASCIDKAVGGFFVEGLLPEEGARCSAA